MENKKGLGKSTAFKKKPLAVTGSAFGSIYCFRSWAQQADHTKNAKKSEESLYLFAAIHAHIISQSSLILHEATYKTKPQQCQEKILL